MTETGRALPRGPEFESLAPGKWAWPSASSTPLLILLLLIVALRCWVAGRMDFEVDEPYYWLWSRRLQTSYFDHPPMVAYFVRIGTFLFGDTMLGVRSMAIASIVAASVLVYAMAVILFGDHRIGLLSLLWFNMMPHTTFFSILMFPDAPAILFWMLACVALALVWRSGRGEWWYLVGAAMGLLLLSKYTGIFLGFGICAWLMAARQMRPWLSRREPYLAALIALAVFTPVILWNAQHGWASFGKQFGRALETSSAGGFANVVDFIGIQAAFISPLIFLFVIAGLAVATIRGLRRQEANWLLLALIAVPTLLYFLIHAFSAEVLPNWPSAAYPAAIIAAVAAFASCANAPQYRLTRWGFAAAPWVGLALTLVMCAQMTVQPFPIKAADDPLCRFVGWAELASDTGAVAKARHAGYIATSNYDTTGTLAFHLRDITVFQISEPIRYESLPPVDQALLARSSGIYLAPPGARDLARLQQRFDSIELISTIWRTRKGDPIEPYRIYELRGYRGGLPF